ncbi:MAG TPA: hypothetical protein PKB13_09480 [Clostridia bacterium]|nr:hypothetical protein [Clostridia bacterium]
MKKFAMLLAAFVLCLTVTACAGSQQSNSFNGDVFFSTPDVPAASTLVPSTSAPVPVTTTSAPTKEPIESQLQIIAEHSSIWLNDADAESYGFAVTDLDHNGRLEIIFSTCQGTGIYSYNQMWEVNDDFNAIALCETETVEGDSQADIMVPSVLAFYDSGSNVYSNVFDDLAKNGAAEYYENKRAISLQEGKLLETPLAYKSTIYSDASSSTVTCTDAEGKEITQEEYENIADMVFSNYEKREVSLGWVTNAQGTLMDMSTERLYAALKESYDSFAAN